jgi:hypothetical protein
VVDDRSLVNPASQRAALEVLRDTIAKTIAECEPSNVAALAKQYRDTVAALAALPDAVEENPIDELASRRDGRKSAQVPKRAAVGGQRGKRSG